MLKRTINQSIYAPYIIEFIEMKQKLGFEYRVGIIRLRIFDEYVAKLGETELGITKELANKWGEKRLNEADLNRYERVMYLRNFAVYLNNIGIKSYEPILPKMPLKTFVPYIYSQEELNAIFKCADLLENDKNFINTGIIAIPALVRLLYGTGLRIGEATELKNENVDLSAGLIFIKRSKNGKERVVPISKSLQLVLQEYVSNRECRPRTKHRSDYFFLKVNGQKLSASNARPWIRYCLTQANIPYPGGRKSPRIHDMRHTFAVHSFAAMARSGLDLYTALPILSTYLGHGSLDATNHYVRLTANMFPDLIKQVDIATLGVFPTLPEL